MRCDSLNVFIEMVQAGGRRKMQSKMRCYKERWSIALQCISEEGFKYLGILSSWSKLRPGWHLSSTHLRTEGIPRYTPQTMALGLAQWETPLSHVLVQVKYVLWLQRHISLILKVVELYHCPLNCSNWGNKPNKQRLRCQKQIKRQAVVLNEKRNHSFINSRNLFVVERLSGATKNYVW